VSQSVASSANRNLLNRYLYHTYFNSTDFLLNLPDSILCVAFFSFLVVFSLIIIIIHTLCI